LGEVKSFIEKHNIKLLVIDTLSMFWDIEDENDNAEIARRLKPLVQIARGTSCTVLFVHHERKDRGEGDQHGRTIRGGSALLGTVDQALVLDRRRGGAPNQRVLEAVGRYSETPPELIIELVDNQYRRVGTPEGMTLETNKSAVWGALSHGCSETEDRLVFLTNLSKRSVRDAIAALGPRIARHGDGVKGDPFRYERAETESDSVPVPLERGGTGYE
jgi:hypothetical protein